ncbi:Tripartite-type tricarboxylate transporter, receptor component TctC [Rhodoplanes sp. JGI PP 4-B12]|nr:Tripartite-type tricarboxylate transporter, receptor component TctC [Rhodoplanes sp. JGI PP 4-B12]
MRRRDLIITLGSAALAARGLATTAARAATYPERPVRLIVPFPPGGGFDAVGRPWADRIKPLLGTIVVENQGGGGSSLGAASVAHSSPDGYTLLLGGSSTHVTEAILKTRPLYDPMKDLDPISNIAVSPFALAVHPSIPAGTLSEFIDYNKANPGKLSYGHAGVGSLNHLTGELFKSLAGLPDLLQVPYRGSGPAIADALAGHVSMVVPAMTGQMIEFHRTDKLRILAVTGPNRLGAASDLPTAAETLPAMISQQSIGLFAPAGTAKAIIKQIAAANHALLAQSDYQKMLVETGFEPDVDSSPEIFGQRIEAEIMKWTPIVQTLGIRID